MDEGDTGGLGTWTAANEGTVWTEVEVYLNRHFPIVGTKYTKTGSNTVPEDNTKILGDAKLAGIELYYKIPKVGPGNLASAFYTNNSWVQDGGTTIATNQVANKRVFEITLEAVAITGIYDRDEQQHPGGVTADYDLSGTNNQITSIPSSWSSKVLVPEPESNVSNYKLPQVLRILEADFSNGILDMLKDPRWALRVRIRTSLGYFKIFGLGLEFKI